MALVTFVTLVSVIGLVDDHSNLGGLGTDEGSGVELGNEFPFLPRLQSFLSQNGICATATATYCDNMNVFLKAVLDDERVLCLGVAADSTKIMMRFDKHLACPLFRVNA